MSLNTAHVDNGVLIHNGEYILLHCPNVSIAFVGNGSPALSSGKKEEGRVYLTSHRFIFINKKTTEPLISFSAPFFAMSDIEVEQPMFSSNYIKAKVRAQPNGNFFGEVKLKLYFNSGGAIEYAQAMMRAAKDAEGNFHRGGVFGDNPPPYTEATSWQEAPPPAYEPPPNYYGWLPQHSAFTAPPPNAVFVRGDYHP